MSTNILFIFEGEKTEKVIVKSLEKHLLNNGFIIKCAFAADIYQLYREIIKDVDLDVFNLIKERNTNALEKLSEYSRNDFAEIYLFFDYDAHASLASSEDQFGNVIKIGDEKIIEMLSFFDNETNSGKLYLSYPMVEAVRHINEYEDFKELNVKCKGRNCQYKEGCADEENCKSEPHYKHKVSSESKPTLCNINGYNMDTWKLIIKAHLSKMNYIVNGSYVFPQKTESQFDIFMKQLEKHINKKCPMVAVLSAFPLFFYDYYGHEKTVIKLS